MAKRSLTGPDYPIRAVARMTGLSVDTLRAWERRYEAVVPGRSERGRLYTEADVVRLRQLGELVKRGHAIGTVAGLPDTELARLLKGSDAHAEVAPHGPVVNLDPLMDALDRYDLVRLESHLNRYAVVLPPQDLVFSVIVPLLREVGRRWESGSLQPAQEHLVSAIVRSVVGGLLRTSARPGASPTIVFATPAGERHELGLLCAAVLAASAGCGVIYLGADLPAADIAHAASEAEAAVIIVSLTTAGAVPPAELRRLARPPRGVELWVGGPESQALLTSLGSRGRHINALTDVIPMLSRHVH
jgi:MerR family transcriptional regulator, light-induced transcriptional regulator